MEKEKKVELIRLPEVLKRIPVSKSSWYQGIKDGRFPAPKQLSARCSAWLASDIDDFINGLSGSI
jgi:prophage regulatory protein